MNALPRRNNNFPTQVSCNGVLKIASHLKGERRHGTWELIEATYELLGYGLGLSRDRTGLIGLPEPSAGRNSYVAGYLESLAATYRPDADVSIPPLAYCRAAGAARAIPQEWLKAPARVKHHAVEGLLRDGK